MVIPSTLDFKKKRKEQKNKTAKPLCLEKDPSAPNQLYNFFACNVNLNSNNQAY